MLVLLWLSMVLVAVGPALSQDDTQDCEVYEAELHSRPDFKHRVMTSSLPLPPDFSITSVEPNKAKDRSFYWCEMKVNDGDGEKTLRRFGHNATLWWVTKGCGGWFIITACRGANTDINFNFDPFTTPTTVTVTPAPPGKGRKKIDIRKGTHKSLNFADLNSGALRSLYTWLQEQDTPIHYKLGGHPNRVTRSVDEEFAAEFGHTNN